MINLYNARKVICDLPFWFLAVSEFRALSWAKRPSKSTCVILSYIDSATNQLYKPEAQKSIYCSEHFEKFFKCFVMKKKIISLKIEASHSSKRG